MATQRLSPRAVGLYQGMASAMPYDVRTHRALAPARAFSGAKALTLYRFTARLKPCPDTRRKPNVFLLDCGIWNSYFLTGLNPHFSPGSVARRSRKGMRNAG